MGILVGLNPGMVFTVYGNPLPGALTGCQPEPKAEKMAHGRVQLQRPMRLASVQIDGDRSDGDMGQSQYDNEKAQTGRS